MTSPAKQGQPAGRQHDRLGEERVGWRERREGEIIRYIISIITGCVIYRYDYYRARK
jgi:hypothetical protein